MTIHKKKKISGISAVFLLKARWQETRRRDVDVGWLMTPRARVTTDEAIGAPPMHPPVGWRAEWSLRLTGFSYLAPHASLINRAFFVRVATLNAQGNLLCSWEIELRMMDQVPPPPTHVSLGIGKIFSFLVLFFFFFFDSLLQVKADAARVSPQPARLNLGKE